MELGSKTCAKHLGGVESIRLLPACELKSIEYYPSERLFTTLEMQNQGVPIEVNFAEGTASYEERVAADGVVTHTLRFAMRGFVQESVEALCRLSVDGIVAIVKPQEGKGLLVGYSPQTAADSPLRLVEAHLDGGDNPKQRTSTTITLACCDGSLACYFEE